jgi:transposase
MLENTKELEVPFTNNASLKLRYLSVQQFNQGNSRASIARSLNVSRRLVNQWIATYLSEDLEGLALKLATGRPPLLNIEQKQQLKAYIISHAVKEQGGRLMGKDIVKHIQETYGVTYHVRNIYRLMKALGIVWITSRSKHPNQDLDAQEDFKKFPKAIDHHNSK